jgi:hypothetical protein
MMEQQYGKIINMSSLVYRGSAMQFTYSAAKGGVFTFTRSMAMTLGMYNINEGNRGRPLLLSIKDSFFLLPCKSAGDRLVYYKNIRKDLDFSSISLEKK